MFALLVFTLPGAFASTPAYTIPATMLCPPHGCLGVLNQDGAIVPPDYLSRVQSEMWPLVLEELELTLALHAGTVELTVDGVALNPRLAVHDARANTWSWTIRVVDVATPIRVETFNPSARERAVYDLVAAPVE